MKRTITYHMDTCVPAITVGQYLKSLGYTSRSLIQLKKLPEGILVNERAVFVNHPLCTGDILTINLAEEESPKKILPVELPLAILYEDEDLMVINKPAGMPIHPSMNHHENSLANAVAWYFQEKGHNFTFRCVNRLDRDTSGLTIVAKHSISAGILSTMIAAKQDSSALPKGLTVLMREYLAIVRGNPTPPSGSITAPIARKEDSIIEREVNFRTGEPATTHYQVLANKNGHSLLSLRLETGRTHQIRVHLKHLGFPLIGDYLYNPDMEWINRQALHSYKLTFSHPITQERMEFVAPLPEDMAYVLSDSNENNHSRLTPFHP